MVVNPSRGRGRDLIPVVAGVTVIAIGVLVLFTWIFDPQAFRAILPGLRAMKANTAVGLILTGASILLLTSPGTPRRQRLGLIFGMAVAVFGVGLLAEYLIGNLGFDQLLFADSGGNPGRPSPLTAAVFVFLGVSLASLDLGGRASRLSQATGAIASALLIAGLVGLAFGVASLRGSEAGGPTGVALHTALALLVAIVGLAFLRPERGVVAFLSGGDPGAVVARRLSPVAIVLPLLAGFLAREGEARGLFDPQVGLSGVAVLTIGSMLGLIALTASQLRRSGQDRDRINAFARTLIAGAGVGVAACDAEGRLTFFNPELQRIHGLAVGDADPSEWIGGDGTPLREAVLSSDMPLLRALRGEVLRGLEMTIEPQGTGSRHLRVNADPLLDANGATIGAVATFQDETEHRDAEETRRRLAAIVEWSNDAIISKNLDGEIRSWNEAAEHLYGYSAEEAIGSNISIIVPADRLDELADLMRRVAGAERVERFETVRRRKNGQLVQVALTLSPIFDAESKIVGASVIGHDISVSQRADRMFGQLLEMAPDAVIGIGGNGCIEVVNSQTQAMFGYGEEDLIGEPVEVLVPGGLQSEHPDQQDGYAEFARRRDGSEFACEITIAPVETDRGRMEMALVRDVTDRKEIEQEADRLKSEFFGLVSHELRTPLTSIIGYADVLSEEEGERFSEHGRHHLAIVKRNSERLDRLVQDLLLVGQVGAGTFTIRVGVVDIEAVARECVERSQPAAIEAGVELSVESHGVRRFSGDQGRLNQVLDNLISNALKFTPPRGRVVVRVQERGGACVLDVEDTGLGIGPEEIEHLFDRFYRGTQANAGQVKGVGLGLAITKAIVEAHGGEIEVQSDPGRGSNFRVHLPIEKTAAIDAGGSNQPARSVRV